MDNCKTILALDISTSCIGVSLLHYKNENELPKILKLTHIAPKIPSKIKGMRALFFKKNIFEKDFLPSLKEFEIDEAIIEEPLISANNANTVASLLRFNGMISESIYRVLGVMPTYISSYDARKYSFPELMALRKFNKIGVPYDLQHIEKAIKENYVVLFGSYPYDIDKKTVMMNLVSDLYPDIKWLYDNKGELRKENFDACDSLVCGLAYINLLKYGEEQCEIIEHEYIQNKKSTTIEYKIKIWDRVYNKTITISNKK